MANMCYNTVSFYGTPEKIQAVEKLFTELAAKEQQDNCGQRPSFVSAGEAWFFHIRWEEDLLYFESRWEPILDILRQVADHFQLEFECEFEELDNLIFGIGIYRYGTLTEIRLDNADLNQYPFDKGSDRYYFEGEFWECQEEILEILLDRKRNLFYGI